MKVTQTISNFSHRIPQKHPSPNSKQVDTFERTSGSKAPSVTGVSAAVAPSSCTESAECLELATRITEDSLPFLCDVLMVALEPVARMLGSPSLSEVPGATAKALHKSGAVKEMAENRAATMSLTTLRARVALIGSPLEQAENKYTLAFTRGLVAASGPFGLVMRTQRVDGPKFDRVRALHDLMPADSSKAAPAQVDAGCDGAAAEMSAQELDRLWDYYNTEAGKQYSREWSAGEPGCKVICAQPKVKEALKHAVDDALRKGA